MYKAVARITAYDPARTPASEVRFTVAPQLPQFFLKFACPKARTSSMEETQKKDDVKPVGKKRAATE